MKLVKRTSVRQLDSGYATRAIGQLLHDPNALEKSFTDVVNTIRLFTEGDDDVDILQQALLRVISNNMKLRSQLLGIVRRSHSSENNVTLKRDVHHNEADDSESVVNAGADIVTSLAASEQSAEELDLLLTQKLIIKLIAESTVPVKTGRTGNPPSPG